METGFHIQICLRSHQSLEGVWWRHHPCPKAEWPGTLSQVGPWGKIFPGAPSATTTMHGAQQLQLPIMAASKKAVLHQEGSGELVWSKASIALHCHCGTVLISRQLVSEMDPEKRISHGTVPFSAYFHLYYSQIFYWHFRLDVFLPHS